MTKGMVFTVMCTHQRFLSKRNCHNLLFFKKLLMIWGGIWAGLQFAWQRCCSCWFQQPAAFTFQVERSLQIPSICLISDVLHVTLCSWQIYLSWKSGPAEVKHWKDMMGHPRTAVSQWHSLKAWGSQRSPCRQRWSTPASQPHPHPPTPQIADNLCHLFVLRPLWYPLVRFWSSLNLLVRTWGKKKSLMSSLTLSVWLSPAFFFFGLKRDLLSSSTMANCRHPSATFCPLPIVDQQDFSGRCPGPTGWVQSSIRSEWKKGRLVYPFTATSATVTVHP